LVEFNVTMLAPGTGDVTPIAGEILPPFRAIAAARFVARAAVVEAGFRKLRPSFAPRPWFPPATTIGLPPSAFVRVKLPAAPSEEAVKVISVVPL
jgi:hypothetical protein